MDHATGRHDEAIAALLDAFDVPERTVSGGRGPSRRSRPQRSSTDREGPALRARAVRRTPPGSGGELVAVATRRRVGDRDGRDPVRVRGAGFPSAALVIPRVNHPRIRGFRRVLAGSLPSSCNPEAAFSRGSQESLRAWEPCSTTRSRTRAKRVSPMRKSRTTRDAGLRQVSTATKWLAGAAAVLTGFITVWEARQRARRGRHPGGPPARGLDRLGRERHEPHHLRSRVHRWKTCRRPTPCRPPRTSSPRRARADHE